MTKSNIQKKFEDLYKDIDPLSRKQDDKKCLQDEASSIRNKEMAKDPKWKEAQQQGSKKFWNLNESKKQRSLQQKKNWKNNKESMTKGLQDRYKDGKLGKKISNALLTSKKMKEKGKKQRNKIMTPDGVFESRKAAAEFYGYKCPTGINTMMKNHPDKYYYIECNNPSTSYKHKKYEKSKK
jgi:hypothetical protein